MFPGKSVIVFTFVLRLPQPSHSQRVDYDSKGSWSHCCGENKFYGKCILCASLQPFTLDNFLLSGKCRLCKSHSRPNYDAAASLEVLVLGASESEMTSCRTTTHHLKRVIQPRTQKIQFFVGSTAMRRKRRLLGNPWSLLRHCRWIFSDCCLVFYVFASVPKRDRKRSYIEW